MKKSTLNDTNTKNYSNNLIGILLLFQPLLNSYSIAGVPGTLSDVSIVVIVWIWIFGIVSKKNLDFKRNMLVFFPLIIYFFLSWYVFTIVCNEGIFIEYFRIIVRYFLLVTMILPDITINYWIKKWFFLISFLLSLYCLMQYVTINFLGIYLPSYIPFLNYREDLKSESDYINYPWFYRPHSIFQEPAHFCEFMLVYLAFLMFDRKSSVKNYALMIFVSATILLSGSSIGAVGLVFLWGTFLFSVLKLRIHKRSVVSFLVVVPFSLFFTTRFIFYSNSFHILLQRVFSSNSASESRFGNIVEVFSIKWNFINYIFGFGFRYDYFADEIGWLPSYFMILLYFGIAGVILFIFTFAGIYINIKNNKLAKILFILFVILNVATEMLFDMHLVMYLFVIICIEERIGYEKSPKSKYYSTYIQKGTFS